MKYVLSFGSSSVFKSALAAEVESSSARRTMKTFARPSCGANAARARNERPHLVDADVLRLLRPPSNRARIVEPALEDDDVRVHRPARPRSRCGPRCAGGGRPVRQRAKAGLAAPAGVVLRQRDAAVFADERLRQTERRQLLADAVGPVEEVSVMHAIAGERSPERRNRRLLSEHFTESGAGHARDR